MNQCSISDNNTEQVLQSQITDLQSQITDLQELELNDQFIHQFHGLQVKICVSFKYTNKQQVDTTMKTREEVKAALRAHVLSRLLSYILTYIRKNPPDLWGFN